MPATAAELRAAFGIVGATELLDDATIGKLHALDVSDDASEEDAPDHMRGQVARARVRATLTKAHPGVMITSPQVWHVCDALRRGAAG